MLIEEISKFELRDPEPPARICTGTSMTGYFNDKTKISKKNLLSGLLFTAKILEEQVRRESRLGSDVVLETGLGSRDTFLKVSSRSRLGFELQVSISSLGFEKSWSRNMRSLETQNLG